jgi:hypothetical protein
MRINKPRSDHQASTVQGRGFDARQTSNGRDAGIADEQITLSTRRPRAVEKSAVSEQPFLRHRIRYWP